MKNVDTIDWTTIQHKTVIVGVSGGVDSMVLLHQLVNLPEKTAPARIIVAHVNHQLREASKEEERFVYKRCEQYRVECVSMQWEHDLIQSHVEERAREVRYQFFAKLMKQYEADVLVTAHHLDDQVETVLMKLVRGEGIRSLVGIRSIRPFQKGVLFRPFLSVSKSDIRKVAEREGILFVEDESNQQLLYQRNRYRLDILPRIEKENAQYRSHLSNAAHQIEELLEAIEPFLYEVEQQCMTQLTHQSWCIQLERWMQYPEALRKQFFYYIENKYAFRIATKSMQHVLYLLEEGKTQWTYDIGHSFRMRRSYERLYIEPSAPAFKTEKTVIFSTGKYQLSKEETLLVSSPADTQQIVQREEHILRVWEEDLPLTIRHRREGDKLCIRKEPIQHQSVARYCINQKIDKKERDRMWIVENKNGTIVGILGYRTSVPYHVADNATIQLKYEKNKEVPYVKK